MTTFEKPSQRQDISKVVSQRLHIQSEVTTLAGHYPWMLVAQMTVAWMLVAQMTVVQYPFLNLVFALA